MARAGGSRVGTWVERRLRAVLQKAMLRWGGGMAGSRYGRDFAWDGGLPGSRFDYESEAGDPALNGVVAICLGWIADNFPEAELRVVHDVEDGMPDPVHGHALTELVADPNPYYDGDTLWAATLVDYCVNGNAYWLKVRSQGGRVVELWSLPYWQVRPCWYDPPHPQASEFISHYVYTVGGEEQGFPRGDIVHFRFGRDPRNPRLGMGRLKAVLREIVTDNECAIYGAALMRNMAIPSVHISPADKDVEFSDEDAGEFRRQWRARYGGEQRGVPMVATVPVKVDRLQLSPEELALDRFRNAPEARICAALRISPMVVGLSVGDLQRSYANYSVARRAAYEDCLMPLGRRSARTLERQLLGDLGGRPGERVVWDYSRVSALREDRTAVYRRNTIAVMGGWMTVNEARSGAGLPVADGQDIYLRQQPAGGGKGVGGLMPGLGEGSDDGSEESE